MRTIEEITARMTALSDLPDDQVTDEVMTEFDELETELASAQRLAGMRNKAKGYTTVVTPAGVPSRRPAADGDGRTDLDRAFENYLRTGIPNADISNLRVSGAGVDGPRMAQSEGASAAGGYLVPQGFQSKLVEVRKSFGGFMANADQIATGTGAPLEYPTNDDTANQGDVTAESAAVANGADLTFGTVALGSYKYTSSGANNLPLRVPVELLQDAFFDLEGFISRKLGMRIARKQAPHTVTGTGVGQPWGILASNLTSDVDLATPDTPKYVDLVNLQDALDEEYDENAAWLMRKNTWSQLRQIVDTAGRPLIQASTEGIAGRPERRLLDRRVIIDEAAPLLSSAGITYPIAYGDFREAYVVRRVSNLVVVVNPYSRAANGEVEFTAWERMDATIQNRSAYKILRNNT